jgi:hypothetical protein
MWKNFEIPQNYWEKFLFSNKKVCAHTHLPGQFVTSIYSINFVDSSPIDHKSIEKKNHRSPHMPWRINLAATKLSHFQLDSVYNTSRKIDGTLYAHCGVKTIKTKERMWAKSFQRPAAVRSQSKHCVAMFFFGSLSAINRKVTFA